MSEQTHTPSAKTPRKGARSSRSTTGSDQQIQGQETPGRGGRRGGRGGRNAQQTSNLTTNGEGAFDDKGNYITKDGVLQGQASGKQRPTKKAHNVVNHTPEASVHVPIPQQPFPSLKGTPHKPYAGPTFHASPAASALPMPRFFSKSVPNPASSAPSLQERVDQESIEKKAPQSQATPEQSPAARIIDSVSLQPRNESPLDLFFSAARAEKAKQQSPKPETLRSATPPSPSRSLATKHNPSAIVAHSPAATTSRSVNKPSSHWASIYGGGRPLHNRNVSSDSSRGLFTMEIDSTPKTKSSTIHHQSLPVSATPPASLHRTVSDGPNNGPFHQQSPFYSGSNHGLSTPVLPSEMEAIPARRPGSVPFHHQTQPNPPPRSAGNTPLQTPPPQNHHAQVLHYGNKNLSPMFQASRNNSARNQSQLRKELAESPTGYSTENRERSASSQASMAAQRYLSDMISRSSSNSSLQALGTSSAPPSMHPHTVPPRVSNKKENSSFIAHQPAGSVSNKAMEDDLRRLLKISEDW